MPDEKLVRLPAAQLKDRLRWLLGQRIGLREADEIIRLSTNLLALVDLIYVSLDRLIDLYEEEDVPTPEHAAAWEDARKILGRR